MNKIFTRINDAVLRCYDIYLRIPLAHRRFKNIRILNSMDSIRYIIEHKCSVSRYGDGEIVMLFNGGYDGYQKADGLLAKRLRQVLLTEDAPNHMVALPLPLKSTAKLRVSSKEFWGYFTLRKGKAFRELLPTNRTYLDTQLSRFYIIYADKSQSHIQISLLKELWNKRDVLIVEGKQSRTGIGNDLYANAKSVKRIIGYATDAFSHYDEMLEAIKSNATKEQLILLSYGPTATILAYDLSLLGFQAIDLGHLDIEYEWFKMGAKDNIAIEGKFTNEAVGGRNVKDINDKEYESQIIVDVTNLQ